MSGASSTLDPVEAARADIAQSRDLIAAVADDLHRNQRWFDGYRLAERRHARRLKRQELLYQIELRRQALARLARRNALSAARDTRNVSRSLYAASRVTLAFLRRNAAAAWAWTAPRLHAIGVWLAIQARRLWLTCLRASKPAAAWTAVQARRLANVLAETTAHVWAWTAHQAPIVRRRIVAATSAGLAWSTANLRALAEWLGGVLAFAGRWLRVEFKAAALAASNAASVAAAWSTRNGRRGAVHTIKLSRQTKVMAGEMVQATAVAGAALLKRTQSLARALRWSVWPRQVTAESSCRALVVRRSTALVCIAPAASNLPALRTAAPQAREAAPPAREKPASRRAKPKSKSKARNKRKTKTSAKPKPKPQAKHKPAPARRRAKTAKK